MDGAPVVLAGRIAAAGWRLAGIRVRVVGTKAAAAAAFADACADAPLVLVDADAAPLVPEDALDRARRGTRPVVLVVPSPSAPAGTVPDVVAYARRVLGVAG